jgi:hypothetical protein
MRLDLTDDEAAALIRELDRIIQDDRYPLSPRNFDIEGYPRQAPTGARTAPSGRVRPIRGVSYV